MRLCMCEEIIKRFVCLLVRENPYVLVSCVSAKVSKWMCV